MRLRWQPDNFLPFWGIVWDGKFTRCLSIALWPLVLTIGRERGIPLSDIDAVMAKAVDYKARYGP